MFWSLSSFDPRYRLSRAENLHPKLSRGGSVIPHVECHQSIRSAIHSCLQHHLIVGIAQLRPPQKVRSHGFSHGNDGIQKDLHLLDRKPGLLPVFGSPADGFVLQRQRYAKQQRSLPLSHCANNGGGRARGTPHRRNYSVSVHHEPHITYNITSWVMSFAVPSPYAARPSNVLPAEVASSSPSRHNRKLGTPSARFLPCPSLTKPTGPPASPVDSSICPPIPFSHSNLARPAPHSPPPPLLPCKRAGHRDRRPSGNPSDLFTKRTHFPFQ